MIVTSKIFISNSHFTKQMKNRKAAFLHDTIEKQMINQNFQG